MGSASTGIQSEVYLLYLLQPVFGATMAWLFLRERRRPSFWPLAALALGGAALIVFSFNAAAPRYQLLAAAYVLGAVVLWAAGTVLGRYALAGISFTTTSAMRFVLALPVLIALMLKDQGVAGFTRYSLGELPSFLGIAFVPGAGFDPGTASRLAIDNGARPVDEGCWTPVVRAPSWIWPHGPTFPGFQGSCACAPVRRR